MLILGAILFGITAFLLIIIVLIQCGGRNKDTNNHDNESLNGNERYNAIDEISGAGTDKDKDIECRIDNDVSKKSGSLKSDKLVASCEPRLSPGSTKFTDGTQELSGPDAGGGASSDTCKKATRTEIKNQVPLSQDQITAVDSKQDEQICENSGSGDGIYTKMKPVKEKEECAYSVVNITNRDTEYEIIGGKVTRKQVEKTNKKDVSDYEVFESCTKPELDPVLFAIEDSGASGIYEDVPESNAPQVPSTPCTDDQGNGEAKPQEGHEDQKKKWGLTRFSLMKRSKSRQGQDSIKGDGQSLSSEPPTPEKLSPGTFGPGEHLNTPHGKSEIVFPIISARPKTSNDSLPPLPPMENRKLIAEHRRTFHEIQTDSRECLEKTRTLSGSELDVLATKIADDEFDDMYEVPDRDMSKVKLKSATKGLPVQRPHRPGTSPTLLHREVPKPPTELLVTADDIDGDINENYDTISCTLNIDEDFPAKHESPEAAHEKLESNDSTTEPEYAVVDKGEKREDETKDPLSRETSKKDSPNSEKDKKIEVFIRRTTISSNARDRAKLAAVSKETEVVEIPPPGITGGSDQDDRNHNSEQTPVALEDLYAKVNLEEKHLEEAKKSLYATVDKPKTGKIKIHTRSISDEVQEEYEGGHYTKIKDDVPPSTDKPPQKTVPPVSSEYEELGGDNLQAMFASLGSSKGTQLSRVPAAHQPKKYVSTQGNADYEIMPQMGKNEAGNNVSKTRAPPNDYEEINSEKLNSALTNNKDDYMDIGDMPGCDFKF